MYKILIFILFFPLIIFCQVTDNFSDGDFTNNPTWLGETSEFKINSSKQLQLNATQIYTPPNDTVYLCTSNNMINNTEWSFWVKMSFSTSGNNNGRVYLVSDQQNLEVSLNGYFVQLGDIGDGKDSISLYKQTGTVLSKIIQSHIAYTGNTTNYFGVKVIRDNIGNWTLYSDPTGGINYQFEGSGFDNTFTSTSWFGVFCKYTSSNDTKFYFDNFYVGAINVDIIPPIVSYVLVTSPTQLDITFSEFVSNTTAQNTVNYSVNNGVGNPLTAVKDIPFGSLIHLAFSSSFTPGIVYTVTISNVSDLSGNAMTPVSKVFALYTPKAFDVIINEIMPDPDPVVGLPDYEYMELYNRTSYPLNLKKWTLTIGSSQKVLPSVVIEPDSFLLISSQAAASDLSVYGHVLGVSGFSLTNTGEPLTLSDSLGHIIHSVTYSDTWYQDANKANGGWSLELIDPANPCGEISNWLASNNSSGGTPCKTNSIFSSNPDNNPPHLNSINVLSQNSIQLNFSETVDSTTLINASQYSVDNGIGNPVSVSLIKPDYKKVILNLGTALQFNILYTCTITDTLQDCAGNSTVSTSGVFALYNAKQFDVEINEIMADPDPPVGLPNYEYVELYNRTNYPVGMKGWKLHTGTSLKAIPDATINPHEYLLLVNTNGESSMSSFGNVVGISGFTISNAGETLILYDSLFRIISNVSFTDSWYQDSYKKNGGWSLEQVDPANPCGGESNWYSSNGLQGGTPGSINSVNANNSDNSAPQLVRVSLINNNKIQLYFNEPLDSTYLQNLSNYIIDNGIGNPISAHPVSPDYLSVILDFSTAVQTGQIYTITITDTLKDCVGNILPVNSSAHFAIPQTAAVNDIIINEVLANPKEDGVDYVEIYNRSSKVIDLKQLVLSSFDTINSMLTDIKDISTDGYLIFPQDYLVLTSEPVIIKKQYYTPNPNGFVQMLSLPSFNDDNGIVVLGTKAGLNVIDKLVYTSDMYYPLLNSTSGVSLERINFNRQSDDKTNWHSAAETADFGTPAYKNSQYSEGVAVDDPVSVSPEIFSPDNDGKDDVLNLNYKFDVAGYIANIVVYDASGRLIRNIVKNELLGVSGNFSWNGITDDNEKARIGIYIIYFEVFDLKGNVKHYKKSAVLAGKL